MFRALICPSSGVCDYVVELPHWPYRSWFAVCVGVRVRFGWSGILTDGSPDTTPAESHPNSNTQQTKNNTANMVVQHTRKLLKMEI